MLAPLFLKLKASNAWHSAMLTVSTCTVDWNWIANPIVRGLPFFTAQMDILS